MSCLIFLLLFSHSLSAFEKLSINIEQIDSKEWQLKDIGFSLTELHQHTQQLVLSIRQLSLPEPFQNINLFDVRCMSFSWQENKINCRKGEATLKFIHSSPFSFSFSITEQLSHFNIQNLKLAKGRLSVSAKQIGKNWSVNIKSKGLQLKSLKSLLSKIELTNIDISKGYINADIEWIGNDNGLTKLIVNSNAQHISLQANEGRLVTESLNINFDLLAKYKNGVWQWENSNKINQGELYIDPVYIEIKDEALTLKSQGVFDKNGNIIIHQARLNHPGVIDLNIDGVIQQKAEFRIDSASVSADIKDLENFTAQYISPFVEQTTFEGINLKGQLHTKIEVIQSKLHQLSVDFLNLVVTDDKKRIAIDNAGGIVNWSIASDFLTPSTIHWDLLHIRAIPIEAGQLKFLLKNKSIQLLEQTSIPLLGGVIDINQFNWHRQKNDEPKVFFEGGISHVSLQQLSNVFGWTPLSGKISGYIPGVHYENKTLTVNGELSVNVFDGIIKIKKLASSGLFTDFSRFYMDMEIDNLDLHVITQKFEVGGMEGRVSGYINNLYLENWEPVTFYAWLGTPENDNSRHRISQKAVQNIASIGGGGAADVLSRGFLKFFDTFGYDKLGFGCYLHQGVCQLMGVEAAEQGYYIVKGGGLPRIDVVGYNPQVDWKVLMQRLSRITATDEIVVQ